MFAELTLQFTPDFVQSLLSSTEEEKIYKHKILAISIDLRTFVVKFLVEMSNAFFHNFFGTEKQNLQTFLLFRCMDSWRQLGAEIYEELTVLCIIM